MKKLLLLLLTILPMTAFAQAQETEELDSTDIPVIAYFSKNDSTMYCESHYKCKVDGNDTIATEDYGCNYMLVVKDSTATNYEMEFIPLQCEIYSKQPTSSDFAAKKFWEGLCRIRFSTDDCGHITKIHDWQKVRDAMFNAYEQSLDVVFVVGMDSIINKKTMIDLFHSKFNTEEELIDGLTFTSQLFGLYGKAYSQEPKDFEDNLIEEIGYPTKYKVVAYYEDEEAKQAFEDEQGSEDDYFVTVVSETTIPMKDAMNLAVDIASNIVTENFQKNSQAIKDEMASASEAQGNMTITVNNTWGYFYNGWPKMCLMRKIAGIENYQNIEVVGTEWTNIKWK